MYLLFVGLLLGERVGAGGTGDAVGDLNVGSGVGPRFGIVSSYLVSHHNSIFINLTEISTTHWVLASDLANWTV